MLCIQSTALFSIFKLTIIYVNIPLQIIDCMAQNDLLFFTVALYLANQNTIEGDFMESGSSPMGVYVRNSFTFTQVQLWSTSESRMFG